MTFVRLPSTHSLTQTFLFSSFFYIYFGPHSIAISKYVHALAPKLLYHGLIRATTERSHSVFMKSTAIRSRINGHIFSGGFHYKVIFLLRISELKSMNNGRPLCSQRVELLSSHSFSWLLYKFGASPSFH